MRFAHPLFWSTDFLAPTGGEARPASPALRPRRAPTCERRPPPAGRQRSRRRPQPRTSPGSPSPPAAAAGAQRSGAGAGTETETGAPPPASAAAGGRGPPSPGAPPSPARRRRRRALIGLPGAEGRAEGSAAQCAARRRGSRLAAPLPRRGREGMRRPPPAPPPPAAPVPLPPAEHAHGPEEQGGGGRPAVGAQLQRVGAHAGSARLGGRWCLAVAGDESFARPPAPCRRGARPAGRPSPAHPEPRGLGLAARSRTWRAGPVRPGRLLPGERPERGGSRPPARPRGLPAAEGKPPACGERLRGGGKVPGRSAGRGIPGPSHRAGKRPPPSDPLQPSPQPGRASVPPPEPASGRGAAVRGANGARLGRAAAVAAL